MELFWVPYECAKKKSSLCREDLGGAPFLNLI